MTRKKEQSCCRVEAYGGAAILLLIFALIGLVQVVITAINLIK